MKAVIDTNVFVYDTFSDSLYHGSARKLLDGLRVWAIPIIVLYEYVWFMKGLGIDSEDVRDKLMEYIDSGKTVVVREGKEEIKRAMNTIVHEYISLSRFNDKVILQLAVREGLPVASYDRKLRKQADRLGIRVVPRML